MSVSLSKLASFLELHVQVTQEVRVGQSSTYYNVYRGNHMLDVAVEYFEQHQMGCNGNDDTRDLALSACKDLIRAEFFRVVDPDRHRYV